MTNIRYKLTDEHGQTLNNTQWGEGVTHTAPGNGELCSAGWIHVYTDPLLAVLLNPIDANFMNPILWKCKCSGASKSDSGLKEGWTSVATTRRLELPVVTTAQRIAFGILAAQAVCGDAAWAAWADAWLSGADRSRAAALAAASALAAAEALGWAARLAAAAASAAAAWAAEAAAALAADAAAWAAWTDGSIDLIALAKRAVALNVEAESIRTRVMGNDILGSSW